MSDWYHHQLKLVVHTTQDRITNKTMDKNLMASGHKTVTVVVDQIDFKQCQFHPVVGHNDNNVLSISVG